MAKANSIFTVRCDACGVIGTPKTEEQAQFIAQQHVGGVHRDASSAHFLGQHIHIDAPDDSGE
jgi:hypothetical protein